MTLQEMQDLFEKYNDLYLKFDIIKNPKSKRPDLHAFILLDELQPGTSDMISASTHDEFYLNIDTEVLAQYINEDQIKELIACGVRYSEYDDCFSMFA